MGKAIIAMIGIVLLVYSFFDLLATPTQQVRALPKWLWLLIVIIVPFIGPVLWLLLGNRGQAGGPGRPRFRRGLGPDDDPDYLRGL